MKLKIASRRGCSVIIGVALLLGLNSCGVSQPNMSQAGSEQPASSVVEEPLSVTHPFVYSDVTWSTSPDELESITGESMKSSSYMGNAKKRYFF